MTTNTFPIPKQKLIPLLRVKQPSVEEWMPFFQKSIDAGRYSNHGPCYLEAVRMIEKRMTYNCLLSNATVALELALRARFKPGSSILIPSFTFKATYLAVRNAGMLPVSAAVDEWTWALNPNDIVRSGCDGAIVVSPFGGTLDFSIYEAISVPIIYDLAGSWGNDYKGQNIAIYSFHATKNFSIGEGACVVSSDYNLVKKIEGFGNFEITNAKLSEIQCALVCATLNNGVVYPELFYPYQSSTLDSKYCSLLVYSFPPEAIYSILVNNVFESRRYYAPLIEDGYDVSVFTKTPLDHPTRSTIALPRNTTKEDFAIVTDTLKTLLSGP